MKTKLLFALGILAIVLISGCTAEDEEMFKYNFTSQDTKTEIDLIDCEHNVICYHNGHYMAAFECIHISDIKECNNE